jgi:predicted secreted Zn-dependent protease
MRSDPGPVFLEIRERPYTVAGSTADHLRLVLGALAPVRAGRRFAAYTDWEVEWRYRPGGDRGRLWPEAVTVTVTATVRWPYWRPPRSAAAGLTQSWERYVALLRAHEQGHVRIAEAAGRAVAAGLAALPPSASVAALAQAAARTAEGAVADARERERAYDVETSHGASLGVEFPG